MRVSTKKQEVYLKDQIQRLEQQAKRLDELSKNCLTKSKKDV